MKKRLKGTAGVLGLVIVGVAIGAAYLYDRIFNVAQ